MHKDAKARRGILVIPACEKQREAFLQFWATPLLAAGKKTAAACCILASTLGHLAELSLHIVREGLFGSITGDLRGF